jgi:hypothetical protein
MWPLLGFPGQTKTGGRYENLIVVVRIDVGCFPRGRLLALASAE